MMKSSIPRVAGSTREERCAGGGPWCSWGIAAASIDLLGGGLLDVAVDDVLHRLARAALDALDQVSSQPPRLRLREGRDHDVVDAEVLKGVGDRGIWVRVADHPRGEQAADAEAVEHELQARARAPAGLAFPALLGDEDDEQLPAVRLLEGLRLLLEGPQ